MLSSSSSDANAATSDCMQHSRKPSAACATEAARSRRRSVVFGALPLSGAAGTARSAAVGLPLSIAPASLWPTRLQLWLLAVASGRRAIARRCTAVYQTDGRCHTVVGPGEDRSRFPIVIDSDSLCCAALCWIRTRESSARGGCERAGNSGETARRAAGRR